jgi:hypothetical protein
VKQDEDKQKPLVVEESWPQLRDWPVTYDFQELRSMREVKAIFPGGSADDKNWLFVGVGGYHGTKTSLAEAEKVLRGAPDAYSDVMNNGKTFVTVLVVHPRLCVLKYGEIQVNLEEVKLLRSLVQSTVKAITESQEANL